MVQKYIFGSPFQTDAVVCDIACSQGEVPHMKQENGEKLSFSCHLGAEDEVYGLGENVRGINKRGWRYCSCCVDEPNHTEDKESLYAAHNFLVVRGQTCFGIFVDTPGVVTFDIGYTHLDEMTITLAYPDAVIYVFEGTRVLDIVKEFRRLIGRSYIPPKWAFGFQQSRWGYKTEEDIYRVVKMHRDNHLPLDSIYLDIDYMERYKDFTIDRERMPHFEKMVQDLKEDHVHVVPIIDAGVKVEEGYSVYEEGLEKGYFCKKEDGQEFTAGVWPGRVHFPDMLNPEARKWFGEQYRVLLDMGVDGFWNDMNEPSIFYAQERLDSVIDQIAALKGRNLDLETFEQFMGAVRSLSDNGEDYQKFYHQTSEGRVSHDRVHNLFGYNMTRAAGEAFERLCPDRRILMFSRSSYVGMHRYGGIWMGDNKSWWQHMLLNYKMQPSLNMVGYLYTGGDIGGFGANVTEDLLIRWMQMSLFMPLMRNHSAMGTREQEVYLFDKREVLRDTLHIRYGLLPYLYSEFMKAALGDEMYFKPLSFLYTEDAYASQVEDQLLAGDSVMTAPVFVQNGKGRYVYLPEEMAMIRMRSLDDYDTARYPAGHHYIEAGLNETLLFIRPDKMLIMSDGGEYTEDVHTDHMTVFAFVKERAVYEWYDDDGIGKAYDDPDHMTRITVMADGTYMCEGRNVRLAVKML